MSIKNNKKRIVIEVDDDDVIIVQKKSKVESKVETKVDESDDDDELYYNEFDVNGIQTRDQAKELLTYIYDCDGDLPMSERRRLKEDLREFRCDTAKAVMEARKWVDANYMLVVIGMYDSPCYVIPFSKDGYTLTELGLDELKKVEAGNYDGDWSVSGLPTKGFLPLMIRYFGIELTDNHIPSYEGVTVTFANYTL